MSPEIIAIVSVGVALAGLILNGQRAIRAEQAAQRQEIATLREDLAAMREEIAALRERMAHLEGLLEGLREAITRERVA